MEIASVEPETVFWESLEHFRPLEILQKKVENIIFDMSSKHVETYNVSRLHAERDVCKGITDNPTNGNAEDDCDHKTRRGSAKPAPMATDEDGTQRKTEPPIALTRRVCQISEQVVE